MPGRDGPSRAILGGVPALTERTAVRFAVFGRTLRLACAATDLPLLREQWSRCLAPEVTRPEPDARPEWDVIEPREGGRTAYLYAVQMRVTMAAIAAATGELLMWHEAGLSTPDGRVLGLVASSGTGKTTATAHLAAHGWGYVTDETLACTPDGRVLPYAKPLAFRRPDTDKSSVGPDELGLAVAQQRLTLHRMVLLDRDPAASDLPTLEPVGLIESVFALVEQSSGLVALDRPLQQMCALLDRVGGAWRLTYAEIADAAPVLTRLMDDQPVGDRASWSALPADEPARRGPVDPDGDTVWRAPYLDAVSVGPDGDEAIVLVGSVPAHLQGIGTQIWSAAGDGICEADLPALLQQRYGPHPDAAALARAAVDDLVQASVLVRGWSRRGWGRDR